MKSIASDYMIPAPMPPTSLLLLVTYHLIFLRSKEKAHEHRERGESLRGESGTLQGPDLEDPVSCAENFGPYSRRNRRPFKLLKRVKQCLMWLVCFVCCKTKTVKECN